jgi:hypothetical protein
MTVPKKLLNEKVTSCHIGRTPIAGSVHFPAPNLVTQNSGAFAVTVTIVMVIAGLLK